MRIPNHNGYRKSLAGKNGIQAFERCFQIGFGTETHLRDLNGELEIARDPALPLTVNSGPVPPLTSILQSETQMIEPAAILSEVVVVSASNDRSILENNLARSPIIHGGVVPLHVEWNAPSAAIAYNRGLDATTAEYVVFAHQDVYLPNGWAERLQLCINELNVHDPNWAVLGSFGVDLDGNMVGPVWSTSLGRIIGKVATGPTVVQSFDELLMVVRRSSGLRFDEAAPNFHFYGLDAVQNAHAFGKKSYVMSLPVVHNDKFHGEFGEDFSQAFRYMHKKWRPILPLRTSVITISWHGLNLKKSQWVNRRSYQTRHHMSGSTEIDPEFYAAVCGWDDITPPQFR